MDTCNASKVVLPGLAMGHLQRQMGLEPSRGLWLSTWLREGPALKIKQVLQSFLFSQAWWLSTSAKQPPFVQKCPCVLPQLLGYFLSLTLLSSKTRAPEGHHGLSESCTCMQVLYRVHSSFPGITLTLSQLKAAQPLLRAS